MIRICHIIDDAGFGGVVRYLDTLAAALGPRVLQNRIVADTGRVVAPQIDADVLVVHATMAWRKLPFLISLRLRNLGRSIVLVEHSYTEAYEQHHVTRPQRFRAMLRLAYRCADRVVAVSFGQAAWMRRVRLLSATRLAVIPSFTDVAPLRTMALPQDRPLPIRYGAFGRYAEQKGFDTLIEAMRAVPPELATLEVRGLGPDGAALTRLAEGLANVSVGGAVDDVGAFLASVDAIVVPSRWEAFGQVALEARAAGRPVIVTAVDGLVEQAGCGAGVLVAPGNADELGAALRSLAGAEGFAAMALAARMSTDDHMTRSVAAWFDVLGGLDGVASVRELRAQPAIGSHGAQPS